MDSQLDPKKQAQYNKELEKTKEIQGEQVKSVEDLKQSLQDILFLTRDYASEARNATKAVFENTVQASAASKAFRDLSGSSRDITREYGEIAKGSKKISDISKDLSKLEKNKLSLQVEQQQALSKILTESRFGAEVQDDINLAMNTTAGLQDVMFKYAQNLTEEEQYLLDLYNQQNISLDEQSKDLEQIAKQSKNIGDAANMFGDGAVGVQDIGKGLDTVLGKLGLGGISDKLDLESASKSAREYASTLTDNGTKAATISDKFKSAKHYAGEMGKNLTKSLGPAVAIGFLVAKFVEAFKFIDSSSGEVAKNFGISAKEGRKLVAASNQAAISSGDLLVSTKDVLAAQTALNAQFGTSVEFSGEFAAEFASVQERTGLSSKAMGRFAEQSMIVGGSIKDQLADVQGVTMAMNAQEGLSLSQKDIQEGIANISNASLLSAGRNTKELANQVFQSKLLGVSQSQLETIGSSLLDFSSSIESEMQAELLLGKQLNLERARAAALSGDQATLAAEIRREVGTAAEFGKLNVIQQKALASAMGMGREEMASMLVEQEKLNAIRDSGFLSLSDAQEKYNKALEEGNLTEELKNNLQEAGILNQFESATQQERMNALMDKFSDLFIRLAEPLMPLLDGLVSFIEMLEPFLGTISGAIAGFMIGGPLGAAVGAVVGAGVDISSAMDRNTPSSGSLPGLATGGIVTRPTTALIGEGGEPEAVIPLSKAKSMGFGGSDEIKQTNALLKELISAVKQGGDVYIDGAKAGRSLALATSKMG